MGCEDTILLTKAGYFHIWNTLCIKGCKQTCVMFIFIVAILNYLTGCHHQISDRSNFCKEGLKPQRGSVQSSKQGLMRWLRGCGSLRE